jgi:5-methylthioribose kinase
VTVGAMYRRCVMKEIVVHLADCVAALWKQGSKGESLPDINGIVDKAIEQIYREIPDLRELTFSNTSIGRRCLVYAIFRRSRG